MRVCEAEGPFRRHSPGRSGETVRGLGEEPDEAREGGEGEKNVPGPLRLLLAGEEGGEREERENNIPGPLRLLLAGEERGEGEERNRCREETSRVFKGTAGLGVQEARDGANADPERRAERHARDGRPR